VICTNAAGCGLASGASSDLALRLALGIGLLALCLAFALILQVAVMRVLQRRRDAATSAVAARWRPLLLRCAVGERVPVPALSSGEPALLLLLWNHLADSLRGPSHDHLRRVVDELGLDSNARRWLDRSESRQQLLGLLTIGHMGCASDWPRVLALLADPRPYLSLAAARALLQIDPAHAAEPVIDELERRPDWPLARLAVLLRDAGSNHVFEPLRRRLASAGPAQQVRLVRLMAAVDSMRASAALERLMADSGNDEVLSMCLQHVHAPGALPRVRELAQHPVWWLRLQAAGALARLGTRDDLPLLLALMSDPQWWVRYRAAAALASMPGSTSQVLVGLRDGLVDRYARDVLNQVLAERALA
jgi:HEAT repeat protein